MRSYNRTQVSALLVFLMLPYTISQAEVLTFHGTSDASGAVALNDDLFVVADDENNVLRCYSISNGEFPTYTLDLSSHLKPDLSSPEVDLEGATRIGNRIYWISSHGRNKDGKARDSRHRFFATEYSLQNNAVTLSPVGQVCTTLEQNLVDSPRLSSLTLRQASGYGLSLNKKARKKLAPKDQGLNIEALCASQEDGTIYIGFRNPRPENKALVVPLMNSKAVIDKGAVPVFSSPLLWDFHGLGIRDMAYVAFSKTYYILAGAHDTQDKYTLYSWTGKKEDTPQWVCAVGQGIPDFSGEAIVVFEKKKQLLILSDDGTRLISIKSASECLPGTLSPEGTCQNKHLLDPAKKTFRGLWVTPLTPGS